MRFLQDGLAYFPYHKFSVLQSEMNHRLFCFGESLIGLYRFRKYRESTMCKTWNGRLPLVHTSQGQGGAFLTATWSFSKGNWCACPGVWWGGGGGEE